MQSFKSNRTELSESPRQCLRKRRSTQVTNQVANGQLEKPLALATPKFEFGDNTLAENFVVMNKWTWPFIGLHFIRHNSVIIDTTHGFIHFPHLTMQVKSAASETNTKPQAILIHDSITVSPKTTKIITAFVDHTSAGHSTDTVTSVGKISKAARLLLSLSMSTTFDKRPQSESIKKWSDHFQSRKIHKLPNSL